MVSRFFQPTPSAVSVPLRHAPIAEHSALDHEPSELPASPTQSLQHIIPGFLFEHQGRQIQWLCVWDKLSGLVLTAKLPESRINLSLLHHHTRLRATSLGAKLGAEVVQVERAVLEIRVRLELVPTGTAC